MATFAEHAKFYPASQERKELGLPARPQNCGKHKSTTSPVKAMMKTLKSIVALIAVAVIVGQVRTEQRAVIEARNPGLRLSPNSEPPQVLVRACGNCHSDQTDWPWYDPVPPVSWWIARHVREGKEKLDFSEWEKYSTTQKRDKLEPVNAKDGRKAL
jgi:hypothetical protein